MNLFKCTKQTWQNYAKAAVTLTIHKAIAAGIHEELEQAGFLVENNSDFGEISILSDKYNIDGSSAPILTLRCITHGVVLINNHGCPRGGANEQVGRVDYESPTMMEQIVELVKYWRKKAERPYL